MEYKIEPHGEKFDVVNSNGECTGGTFDTQAEADRRVKLLNNIQEDEAWDD